MPIWILYFNLKDGVSEERAFAFIKKYKELFENGEVKVEGLGSVKLYRHHMFGANRRAYQLHHEFKDFATFDRFTSLLETDTKFRNLLEEWFNIMDFKTHYDDFVREVPL